MTEPLRCAFNQATEREALAQGAALATVTDDGQRTGEALALGIDFWKPCGLPAAADQNSSGTKVVPCRLVAVLGDCSR